MWSPKARRLQSSRPDEPGLAVIHSAVILMRSRVLARRLEGWPHARMYPSRLAAARRSPQDDGDRNRPCPATNCPDYGLSRPALPSWRCNDMIRASKNAIREKANAFGGNHDSSDRCPCVGRCRRRVAADACSASAGYKTAADADVYRL